MLQLVTVTKQRHEVLTMWIDEGFIPVISHLQITMFKICFVLLQDSSHTT